MSSFRSDFNTAASLVLRTQQHPAFSIFITSSSPELASSHLDICNLQLVPLCFPPFLLRFHHLAHTYRIAFLMVERSSRAQQLTPQPVFKCPTTTMNFFSPVWLRPFSKLTLTPSIWYWHSKSSAFPDCFSVCI
jgi:hypothetical protein